MCAGSAANSAFQQPTNGGPRLVIVVVVWVAHRKGDPTPSGCDLGQQRADQPGELGRALDLRHVTGALEQVPRVRHLGAHGRYGFSNINIDRNWVGRDVVGIDAGAAVLGVDNFLMADRVRKVFETVPCVRPGMERLGFTEVSRSGFPA